MTAARTARLSEPTAAGEAAERVAKRIARAGVCSRRDAERWVEAGRVAVDGKVLTSPAVTVTAANLITIDGVALPEAQVARLFRYHKPAGLLTTAYDPKGRPTNDGGLKRRLELPATGWLRRYRVRVHGKVDETRLGGLTRGIRIDGFDYGPIEAEIDRVQGSNVWLKVALREGKNREIRRIMDHFGWPVTRLIRLSFGPFQLGGLAEGAVEEVSGKVLKEQLGALLGGGAARPRRPRAARRGDLL